MKPSVILKKAYDYLTDKDYRVIFNSHRGLYNNMDDEEYLCLMYRTILHKNLNLDNPQTFNEKLQWLKLHDHNPLYTTLVDKYRVREYIAETIGEEYLIPLLGVYDSPDEIDFDKLPNQFVLKCNHNSGTGMCICKDKSKLDIPKVKRELRKGLKENYYLLYREWPYKDVERKIVCEKYMEDSSSHEAMDYKFFCFGGMVKCYKVNFDTFTSPHSNYYAPDGTLMKIGDKDTPPDFNKAIPVTASIEKMKELAEKLASSHSFLRTDFYDIDGRIYFGELTFYHDAGFCDFLYEGNDELLGSWLKLPDGGGISLRKKKILQS